MKTKMGLFGKLSQIVVLIVLIIITFSYAMFQGGFVSWFIFYTLTPFFLYSLLLTFFPIRIKEVNREFIGSKLQRGDSLKVKIKLQNKSWFPLIFMTIEEVGLENKKNKFEEHLNQIFFVGWKREFEWTYELNHLERGKIQFQSIRLTFTDLFGWTIRTQEIERSESIIVLPRVTPIHYNPIQMQYEQGGVAAPLAMVKDTTLVTGVRDYQAGDRFSWIHWKSFAKSETLRTKEFEDRQTQDIFLMIDQSVEQNFEPAVDLAASILRSVVKNRGDISFLSVGDNRQYFPAVKDLNQLEKVMHHLAEIEPNLNQSIDIVLSKEVSVGQASTVLLVTGEISKELERFFINSAKFTKGIVCFVISDKKEKMSGVQKQIGNVKIITVTKEQSENIFAEVLKF